MLIPLFINGLSVDYFLDKLIHHFVNKCQKALKNAKQFPKAKSTIFIS